MIQSRASIFVVASVGVCLGVLLLPEQRTTGNLQPYFAENGLELISHEPALSGCGRMGGVRFEARTTSGEARRGLLCINKSMMFGHLKLDR